MNDAQDRWVTLKSFNWISEALVLKTRLEDEGIPCVIPEENTARINPVMTGMLVRIQVREADLKSAREIINDIAPQEGRTGIEKCPVCGSDEFIQDHGTIQNWFRAVVGLLFMAPVRPRSHKSICRHCNTPL